MAQWLGHLVWDQGIAGSNPAIPIFYLCIVIESAYFIWIRNEVSAELARIEAYGDGIESCHSEKYASLAQLDRASPF